MFESLDKNCSASYQLAKSKAISILGLLDKNTSEIQELAERYAVSILGLLDYWIRICSIG